MLTLLQGDALEQLATLPDCSVQCCVTSPPYWGLRDYGTAQWEGGDAECEHVERNGSYIQGGDGRPRDPNGFHGTPNKTIIEKTFRDECGKCGARRIDAQLGLESTPEEYIANMVAVFREVWRVLRDNGTLWLNLGDSYANTNPGSGGACKLRCAGKSMTEARYHSIKRDVRNLKPKDLCMMPARVALALQADGWFLRSEIVWAKPNPMPESCTDRPTKAHEMIYLLAKNGGKPLIWRARDTGEWSYQPDLSEVIKPKGYHDAPAAWDLGDGAHTKLNGNYKHERQVDPDDEPIPRWKGFDYFYDAEAIREVSEKTGTEKHLMGGNGERAGTREGLRGNGWGEFRNKRTVWTIATQPYSQAHFATFPEEIPKLCILAGSKSGDTVLDPFAGSGTVGQVALELGRRAILIELNPQYCELVRQRCAVTIGMF